MSKRVLIIGAGGVGNVVVKKCAMLPEIFGTIMLAKELGVKPPTMTGILDTLEKNDFIQRTPSKEDRRVIQVTLSKNGIKQLKNILPDHLQRIYSAFQLFDVNFQTKQRKLFSMILESLENLNKKES